MGYKQDKLDLLFSTHTHTHTRSMAILELFWILAVQFMVCHAYVVNNEASCFFGSFHWGNQHFHIQKLKVLLLVYTSWFFTNRLQTPADVVYKLNIYVGYLVSSSMACISKPSSLVTWNIVLKHMSLQTTIHTPPFCRFSRNLIQIWSLVMWDLADHRNIVHED
jgi:hypothetical protein